MRWYELSIDDMKSIISARVVERLITHIFVTSTPQVEQPIVSNIVYGTTDVYAGSPSPYPNGTLYVVYK